MEAAFAGCENLIEINLGNINAAKINYLDGAFSDCPNLEEIIGIEKLNTSNVIDFELLFKNCLSLTKLDLSNWNTHYYLSQRLLSKFTNVRIF